jgi:phage gp29-like protein
MAISGLLDQFGKPIPREQIAALKQEISPVGGQYARPPYTGDIAWGINPQRLGAIVKAAKNGSSYEWFVLAEEIEEHFPHYATVLGKRKRQVVQMPITVAAADEKNPEYRKHAEFVRDWIKTGVLQLALFDMVDAIGKGFSVQEIIWEQEPGISRPARLAYRPQRFFEFSYEDGNTLWLRSEKGLEPLQDHKFLVHRHPYKSGNTVRAGLTMPVAFLWCYASFTLKDWALFVQAYGLPIRVGKYGPGASDDDKRVLWRAVSSIAGDVAAIIPESMTMEFVTHSDKAAGAVLYEKRMDWLNREVSKLVLGGTAGTEAIAGGHAVGREHRAGEDDVEKFDAFLLNVTINRQLVAPMIAFTFGPQKEYPTITIGRPNEIPIKDVVEAVADLGSMGLKVKASEIRERLGLSKPEDGDEVVGGAAAPVEKPVIPTPAKALPMDGFSQRPAWLGALISRHSEAPDDVLDALTTRLADDAAGAMHGLTEHVRVALHAATDMRDLASRLHDLKLPRAEFTEAMARGMALAEMVGQASLVEELRGQK